MWLGAGAIYQLYIQAHLASEHCTILPQDVTDELEGLIPASIADILHDLIQSGYLTRVVDETLIKSDTLVVSNEMLDYGDMVMMPPECG
jgi:hypothetical protein